MNLQVLSEVWTTPGSSLSPTTAWQTRRFIAVLCTYTGLLEGTYDRVHCSFHCTFVYLQAWTVPVWLDFVSCWMQRRYSWCHLQISKRFHGWWLPHRHWIPHHNSLRDIPGWIIPVIHISKLMVVMTKIFIPDIDLIPCSRNVICKFTKLSRDFTTMVPRKVTNRQIQMERFFILISGSMNAIIAKPTRRATLVVSVPDVFKRVKFSLE